jgi:hypothetical protein
MKTKLAVIVIGVVAIGLNLSLAQSNRSRAAKEFMRDKLELSQKVLEGVATEDWDLVIAKGTKLLDGLPVSFHADIGALPARTDCT